MLCMTIGSVDSRPLVVALWWLTSTLAPTMVWWKLTALLVALSCYSYGWWLIHVFLPLWLLLLHVARTKVKGSWDG
jgi:hypothetical protein